MNEVQNQLESLPRKDIAGVSIEKNGRIIVAENMDQAIHLANISGPEHVELLLRDPFHILPRIRCAGAVFIGEYSPEPLGDSFAGPNRRDLCETHEHHILHAESPRRCQ